MDREQVQITECVGRNEAVYRITDTWSRESQVQKHHHAQQIRGGYGYGRAWGYVASVDLRGRNSFFV